MLFNITRLPRLASRSLRIRASAVAGTGMPALSTRAQPSQTRPFSSSFAVAADPKSGEADHTAESYFKDVDSVPPEDSTVHRVDSSSDAVQRPYEPPSGEWSQAGVKTEEYRSVDKHEPYETKSDGQGDEKLRYGGKETYSAEKGQETSQSGEGPEGKSAGGRKPEGKQ
ncbi:hypothetical protein BV25DRAFT_1817380 [Artomyces pyxidatus]|uniref:Uncharacterized protein n=1 Tax=Artomyces pyxidatus TaxID=48021 RepID=A0ACB8TJH7_9AGAM|nr:hypothetical protein BV25DRAFT_1817380 [Artomyces pyxidatus]